MWPASSPELLAPSHELRLDGDALPPALVATLYELTLHEALSRPARLALTVHDPNGEWQQRVAGRSPHLELRVHDGAAERRLFSGSLVRIEAELSSDTPLRLRLLAADPLHRLSRVQHHRSFPQISDVALARSLAREHGLRFSVDGGPEVALGHVVQDGESDLSLLRRVCGRTGRDVLVRDGVLRLVHPSSSRRSEPVLLEWGGALERAAVETERTRARRVVLRDRDVLAATTLEVAATDGTVAAGDGRAAFDREDVSSGSAEMLEHEARARLDHARRRATRLEASTRGDARLRAGATIRITSAGPPIDGDWWLDRVEHRWGAEGGWTTVVEGVPVEGER